jgi:hypothetical protein
MAQLAPVTLGADSSAVTPSSTRLWGLRWADHFPRRFGDVIADAARFDDALPFIHAQYASIFGTAGAPERFLPDPMTPAKRRFANEMDVFLLRDGGRTVGVLLAHPTDWTTYYMRSVAILEAYRDRHLLQRLVEATYEPLGAAGVERIEGDCSPANVAMMRALPKLGFVVTATRATERWGLRVCFTKFLGEAAETAFARQFCDMQSKDLRR